MSSENRGPSMTTVLPPKSGAGAPKPGDPQWKDNNPKAAFGAAKPGIEYLSLPVILEQTVGMMAGAAKYGAHNYLAIGPSVMTYVSACFRHLAAYVGGEEWDPHAGEGVRVHHLVAAMNCLHVVRAAQIAGIAFDDRPPAMPPGFIESLAPSVEAILRNNPDPVARYLANDMRGPGRILGEKTLPETKPQTQDAREADCLKVPRATQERETDAALPGWREGRDRDGFATVEPEPTAIYEEERPRDGGPNRRV